jgi:UDP-glucose 4-epimerase
MKILVTGGAGFIGSHVADRLLEDGNDVHVIDSLVSGNRSHVPVDAIFHELVIRDSRVTALFEKERFDVIVHHAAQLSVRHSVEDPVFDAGINILGFLQLLEAGRKNGLQKVVFASTGGAIYGEPEYIPQDESHVLRPISPYGISKLASEHYLAYYEYTYGIPAVVLRYANVYGPRQRAEGEAGVIAIFINKLLKAEAPLIFGDGEQTRDYVFVGDVVEANVRALDAPKGGAYNVGTGVETTVNTLFEGIVRLTEPAIRPTYAPKRTGEQMRSVLSYAHIQNELGWVPQFDLAGGLEQTVAWFNSRAARSL